MFYHYQKELWRWKLYHKSTIMHITVYINYSVIKQNKYSCISKDDSKANLVMEQI